MTRWLDVSTIAVNVLGYPLSWIELVGTLLYLASVVLIARRNILTWPVGMLAVVAYGVLFWQIRLYADALEQVYYLVVSAVGWRAWARAGATREEPAPVGWSPLRSMALIAAATLLASLAAGAALTRVHEWAPVLFPAPADFPWIDAATTVMSFVAMGLMARRRAESWIYWIVVDVAGIGLYAVKGVLFVALLYVVLLALAITGLARWHRARVPAV